MLLYCVPTLCIFPLHTHTTIYVRLTHLQMKPQRNTVRQNVSTIVKVCSKARSLVGLLYRRFYGHADSSTVLQSVYTTMIRPRLEYAYAVWDPFQTKDLDKLEAVQKLHYGYALESGGEGILTC